MKQIKKRLSQKLIFEVLKGWKGFRSGKKNPALKTKILKRGCVGDEM